VVIHYPKAKEDDVEGLATIGANVRVVGMPRMGANKKYVVDAMKITNLDNNASMTFAAPLPPAPPPR